MSVLGDVERSSCVLHFWKGSAGVGRRNMLRAWLGQCLDQNTPGYLHPISDAVFVFQHCSVCHK